MFSCKNLNKKDIALLFVFGLVTFAGYAQKSSKNSVSKLPVKVTSVEGITEYALNNGLRVLLFPEIRQNQLLP